MKIDLTTVQQNLLNELVMSVSDIENFNKERICYFMIQIRKVLEISNLEKDVSFLTLTFFIDWTFHARKNRNASWLNEIKKKVEANIENSTKVRRAKGIDRAIETKDYWFTEFHKHISLHLLRNDLEHFASIFLIDIKNLFKSKNWDLFRGFLMLLLADAPIEITDADCPVGSILIKRTRSIQEEGTAKHVCDYVLLFKDGSFETVSFFDNTTPISARDTSKLNPKIY